MNFLAHLFLSGNSEKVVMGNFVGDFIKGSLADTKTAGWDREYLLGLRLHRFIDSFTDEHFLVRRARRELSENFPKVSGIIVDIYFDYFLAKRFSEFTEEPLSDYAARMYALFGKRRSLIPEEMSRMVHHMVNEDWLGGYAHRSGIDITFQRMSRRTSYLSILQNATDELFDNEDFYGGLFKEFFPELQTAVSNFIETGHG